MIDKRILQLEREFIIGTPKYTKEQIRLLEQLEMIQNNLKKAEEDIRHNKRWKIEIEQALFKSRHRSYAKDKLNEKEKT